MNYMLVKKSYVREATKQILILRTYLAEPHIVSLYGIIYHHGYRGVLANIKPSKRFGIWEIMDNHNLLNEAKMTFSLERFACSVMAAIWYHYYSPALICTELSEKYSALSAAQLAGRFFAVHEQIIDYWPFSGDSPFAARQRELTSHCDEYLLHPEG